MPLRITRRWIMTVGLILLAIPLSVLAQATLDPRYHTYEEIVADIFALEARYPDMVKVDSIGHSRGETDGYVWPIYAVKISDNVQVNEDEPSVLFVGHIHAEEVLGIEIIHALLHELTDGYVQNLPHVRYWVQQMQIYIVPSMNPDGLAVVMDGRDVTYRKNGYRPPPLESCTIHPGMGWDSCGVDLNRVFDLNWAWGDTLWQPGGNEPYDYYRGPAPFSEPESQCIRDLALQIQPVAAVIYHSSRTGDNAERCIFAWDWNGKLPPDSSMIGEFGRRFALQIPTYDHASHYLFTWGGNRRGNTQDWFYWRLGTLQCTNEVGSIATGIQPDSAVIEQIIRDVLPAVRFLLDRVRTPDNNEHIVYGNVRDNLTGLPLAARWRFPFTWKAFLPPRYTDPIYGRFYFLPSDSFTVEFSKEGYLPKLERFARRSSREYREVRLTPLPWYALHVRVEDEQGVPLSSTLFVKSQFPDTVDLPTGEIHLSKPEGLYELLFSARDTVHIAYRMGLWLGRDTTLTITLPQGETVFFEDFEDMAANWEFGGEQATWTTSWAGAPFGHTLSTNPVAFRTTYSDRANAWAQYSMPLDLRGMNSAHLQFYRMGHLESGCDSLGIEVSRDGGSGPWESVGWLHDFDIPWTRTVLCLDPWAGTQDLRLRFRLVTDSLYGELGVMIDSLRIIGGINNAAPPSEDPGIPWDYAFEGAYPNPFNPTTVLTFTVAAPGRVAMRITNLLGQEVRSLWETCPSAGRYRMVWNGTDSSGAHLPSGVYFATLQAGEERFTR
ncbi:MAG: T9SS type A sorting domain-containing protein, partial [Calditrichaeota bacterium]|nr:T9SS type A sorting domain-containing protein [Calditrichota bacterium]